MKKTSPPAHQEASNARQQSSRHFGRMALLSVLLQMASVGRTRAQDRADYQYQDYAEEAGRIHVQTHGFYFDAALKPWITLKGNYIHDAISGATPTGAPPIPGQKTVEMATIDEIRNAGFVEAAMKAGHQTFTPQFSYSQESDYKSLGIAFNYAIELNQKNTILNFGVSHSFDQVLPHEGERLIILNGPLPPTEMALEKPLDKDTTDVLLGLTQILGPKTVLTANLTIGYSDGYLGDPYKRVYFTGVPETPPFPYTVSPENRPSQKLREVMFVSVQQFVEKLNGAADLSYRFYHDDFGVIANTVGLQWNQNVGKRVIVSPLFRYYTQTAADFYATSFPGDPQSSGIGLPKYFSADYRLSALNSFTYGVNVSVKIQEHLSLQFAYQRYNMAGTDANTYGHHGATADAQFPRANVFTGGLTLWF